MTLAAVCQINNMPRPHVRTSSYRLQFGPHCGFADATRLSSYLEQLGVSDCYASPLLQAAPSSAHGYDICDHGALNSDLGSRGEFDAFANGLRERGMGLILDFVPNHMGLDSSLNRWWQDVLRHGQASIYADYFDIDWDPVAPELKGRILLPVLQDGYGEVLERGELQLGFEAGAFHVQYGTSRLPMEPRSCLPILEAALPRELCTDEELEILALVRTLPEKLGPDPHERDVRHQITRVIQRRLAALADRACDIRKELERATASFNGQPGDPASFDRLHDILEHQPYRLAHWKTAFDEINYRRFFDVNDLGGLRMEDPRVFEAAHRLVLELVAGGTVTALRIDHPDGLLDPGGYLARLTDAVRRAQGSDADAAGSHACEILVEKILARDELLPESWPVAGTTGYGFLNDVNGLFVDRANEESYRRMYARASGRRDPFGDVVYSAKRLVMGSSMASELAVLARALKVIASSDRRTRDFTLTALRKAITEVVACFPVYRTYVNDEGFSSSDRERIDLAVDRARRRNPVVAQSIFLFLRSVLLAEGDARGDERVRACRGFAQKFQQFSAPVHAKGLEDTAFYRYDALLSLNEVGGDPDRFGITREEFHAGNLARLQGWPHEMTATATHDTKRGEDARARLNVLSEAPGAWRRAVQEWRGLNAVRKTAVDRQSAPDPNDEYFFYQTLIGSWPAECIEDEAPVSAPREFVARVRAYMEKAIKEAKLHTSWVNPNSAYEEAVLRFVDSTLQDPGARGFLASFVPFMRRVAEAGMVNSLSQLVLKIASPGAPDFYNGTETWQFDMADPDNRRPVDFAARAAMLDALLPYICRLEASWSAPSSCARVEGVEPHVGELLAAWTDARIKMFLTVCGLRLRRRWPDVFVDGAYTALRAGGREANHLVAFCRSCDSRVALAVVPRLMSKGLHEGSRIPIGAAVWDDTHLILSPELAGRAWRHAFTGARLVDEAGKLAAADLFRTCPVALLLSDAGTEPSD